MLANKIPTNAPLWFLDDAGVEQQQIMTLAQAWSRVPQFSDSNTSRLVDNGVHGRLWILNSQPALDYALQFHIKNYDILYEGTNHKLLRHHRRLFRSRLARGMSQLVQVITDIVELVAQLVTERDQSLGIQRLDPEPTPENVRVQIANMAAPVHPRWQTKFGRYYPIYVSGDATFQPTRGHPAPPQTKFLKAVSRHYPVLIVNEFNTTKVCPQETCGHGVHKHPMSRHSSSAKKPNRSNRQRHPQQPLPPDSPVDKDNKFRVRAGHPHDRHRRQVRRSRVHRIPNGEGDREYTKRRPRTRRYEGDDDDRDEELEPEPRPAPLLQTLQWYRDNHRCGYELSCESDTILHRDATAAHNMWRIAYVMWLATDGDLTQGKLQHRPWDLHPAAWGYRCNCGHQECQQHLRSIKDAMELD